MSETDWHWDMRICSNVTINVTVRHKSLCNMWHRGVIWNNSAFLQLQSLSHIFIYLYVYMPTYEMMRGALQKLTKLVRMPPVLHGTTSLTGARTVTSTFLISRRLTQDNSWIEYILGLVVLLQNQNGWTVQVPLVPHGEINHKLDRGSAIYDRRRSFAAALSVLQHIRRRMICIRIYWV